MQNAELVFRFPFSVFSLFQNVFHCLFATSLIFVGNAILKMYEGVGATLISEIKKSLMTSFRGKLGGLLIKPSLKQVLKKYDASEYGGAPMLGLNGLVVKAHGSSTNMEIKQAIKQCIQFGEEKINDKIKENLTID